MYLLNKFLSLPFEYQWALIFGFWACVCGLLNVILGFKRKNIDHLAKLRELAEEASSVDLECSSAINAYLSDKIDLSDLRVMLDRHSQKLSDNLDLVNEALKTSAYCPEQCKN